MSKRSPAPRKPESSEKKAKIEVRPSRETIHKEPLPRIPLKEVDMEGPE